MTDVAAARLGRQKRRSGKNVLTETKLTLLDGLLRRRAKMNGVAVVLLWVTKIQ